MKKMSFTNIKSLRWMVLPMVMAVLCCNWAYAQPNCQLNCNDLVRIGVNNDCEALITYDLMLEDGSNSNICLPNGPQAYTIIVMTDADDPDSVLPNSPLITQDDFECGRRFYVKVKHWSSNNACWGEVIVEDKQAPTVVCPPDVLAECTDDVSGPLGDPRDQAGTNDNCTDNDDLVCTYEDVVVAEGCLVDGGEELCKVIERTWTCVDECGNEGSCVQTIRVRRLTCDDIIGVTNPTLSCVAFPEANLDPNAMQQPIPPSVSGTPTYRKLDGSVGMIPSGADAHDVCKISVTYMDKIVDLCGGGYKIIRTFTVLDWCAEELCDEIVQIIKVPDENIDITCPAPLTVGTNLGATSCGWLGNLPAATVTEDCSDFDVVTVVTDADGNEIASINGNGGGPVLLPSAPCETTYTITYTATDECDNVAECSTEITILDDDAPTPVCDEITQVTVDAVDGIAVVYAETFDDGSHDNCCAREDLSFEVRRMGTSTWLPFVTFTCDDCPGPNMVEMRVTDCCGNISESCMIEVLVDDKTPPIIVCPADVTINCDEIADANDATQVRNYIEDFQFPKVTASDNCEVDRIEITRIRTDLNSCGLGTITVTYTAFDGPCDPVLSSSCTQVITIEDNTPISVTFPPDYTANCTTNDGNGFNGSLEPEDLPAPFDGVVVDADCELIAVNHFDEVLPISDGACFKVLRRWVVINWCVYDPNGPQTPANGYYTHIQVLKVLDQEAPIVDCPDDYTVCILDGCTATVDIPVPNATDCVPAEFLDYTVRGDFTSFSNPNVGIGTYNVIITVFDNCGNATECPVTIKVEDCKKPTPYCENGLVVELMPTTGMVEIWASDFDEGSFDNCPGDLIFSFSSDVTETGMTFTCDNRGANTVQIWVTDAAGNQDFCETFVNIQDNMGACGGGAIAPLVAGTVSTEMDDAVEQVTVNVNGTESMDMMTESAGSFNFNLPMDGDYTLTPQKDMNPLNGVTTFDLVRMRKHILGIDALGSPYKMIAADINNSGSITTFDMVELRKVILQINAEFPSNTSWRFVAADYSFPNPANPWAETFPEVINYNNLDADALNADFVAIKVGDLNDSAQPNSLVGTDERNNEEFTFNVADQALVAGNEYTVDFTADLASVEGYQFTLNFTDALELVSINEGVAAEENFGTVYAAEGAITTSWDGNATAEQAFSVTFKATADVQLSEVLSIGSQYTAAEAYNKSNDVLGVALSFNGQTAATGFELFQNTPNPFEGSTVVGFNLPEAGAATLTVYDVNGKVLSTVNGDYAKGYNNVTLSNLSSAGVLYYTLETANETATRKMIMVK